MPARFAAELEGCKGVTTPLPWEFVPEAVGTPVLVVPRAFFSYPSLHRFRTGFVRPSVGVWSSPDLCGVPWGVTWLNACRPKEGQIHYSTRMCVYLRVLVYIL